MPDLADDAAARFRLSVSSWRESSLGTSSGSCPENGVRLPEVVPQEVGAVGSGVDCRQLERFGAIGEGDWRTRDEFAGLATSRREVTEAWRMDQALRFARALRERSHTPHDSRRALHRLERAGASTDVRAS